MKKTDVNIRHSYDLYKKKFGGKIDIKDYIKICNNFNKFIMKKVLEGFEVALPLRMGFFQITGTKQKISFNENGEPKLPPNWAKTFQLWKKCPECKEKRQRVYCTNDETGGIRYKLLWSKRGMLVSKKNYYSFQLSRTNKRNIHKKIVEGKEYFLKTR